MKIVVKGNPLAFFNQVNDREEDWTASEDQIILDMAKVSSSPWKDLSSKLGRSPSACFGRHRELVKENVSDVAPKSLSSKQVIQHLLEANILLQQQIKDHDQRIQKLEKMFDNMQSQSQDSKGKKRQASIVEMVIPQGTKRNMIGAVANLTDNLQSVNEAPEGTKHNMAGAVGNLTDNLQSQ